MNRVMHRDWCRTEGDVEGLVVCNCGYDEAIEAELLRTRPKAKNGVVIGKFMPFHLGHKLLIDTARENSEQVHVVVCSLPTEPIMGFYRFVAVQNTYADDPNVHVHHLTRADMPQEPKGLVDPDFWNAWCVELTGFSKEPFDRVFSSEDYGARLAEELQIFSHSACGYHLVDKARKAVPISGTKIRDDMMANWDYICPTMRRFLSKRVLVTGPESCGKTTMAELLAKHYDTVWAPEFAREYLADIGYNFTKHDLEEIAIGQDRYLREADVNANKVSFTDTCALETHIYCKYYLKEESDFIKLILDDQAPHFHLALLLTPDVKWVQDGLRDGTTDRWAFFEQFKALLTEKKIPFQIISSDNYEARFKAAVGHVDNLLKGIPCALS